MKTLGAFTVVFLACLAYYALALGFGIYQRVPVPHFLVGGLGVLWLAWLTRQKASLGRITGLALGVTVLGLFAWHTLVFSVYDPPTATVRVGESLAERLDGFELAAHGGEPVPVWRAGDRATLVVFYRGFW